MEDYYSWGNWNIGIISLNVCLNVLQIIEIQPKSITHSGAFYNNVFSVLFKDMRISTIMNSSDTIRYSSMFVNQGNY